MQNDQVLQTVEWGNVKGAFGWMPINISLSDGTKLLILKRQLPLIKRSLFYIPRGPGIDYRDEEKVSAFLIKITELAKEHGALFTRIDPEVLEDDHEAVSNLKRRGFIKAKKEIQPRSTYFVDTSKSLEEINSAFESKFRYNIKVAQKHGIKVIENNTLEAVKEFYGIYEQTSSRQTFIIHPFSYYEKVFSEIIQKGKGSIFMAYKDNIPVAGVFIFTQGKRAWYMYGASTNEYRNMMPNNLIHWEVIKWAKTKGIKCYDLWGIPSNPNEKHPLWGVYRFKKGFGGQLKKFIGTYDYPLNRILYKIFDRGIIIYQNILRFIKKGSFSDSLAE